MVQTESKSKIKQIIIPICNLRLKPNSNSDLETQLLFGEKVKIIREINNNWLLCESTQDNYIGYLKKKCIGNITTASHKINNLSSFVYKKPDIKSGFISKLFFNSRVLAIEGENDWLSILVKNKKGYIHKKDLTPLNQKHDFYKNWVDVAIKFLNTPYLWGGKSHAGLDCSALIQLAFQNYEKSFPRNSGDQFKSNLLKKSSEDKLDRGTLIFWKGLVAVAINKKEIIHSNAYHMKVAIEKFNDARKRIENSYGKIIGFKHLS